MIKKALSFLIIFTVLVIGVNSLEVNAGEDYDNKYIKVGVTREIPPRASVRLTGTKFSIGHNNGNGVNELFKRDSNSLVAKIKNFGYHIELSENFSSYDSARVKSNDLKAKGLASYIVYKNGFKVYVGEFLSENEAKQFRDNNNILKQETTNVSSNLALIFIEDSNNEKVISFDKDQDIFIKSIDSLIEAEGKRYRGYIGFVNNAGKLTTVNYIQIGEYLKGVLPGEMPASWDMEALKAQAVSARNFALRTLGKHKSLGYDLCDSDNCQVYGGHGKEHIRTNQAVEETRNKVLKYNGEIAQTFYSSCSGGYTASNEDVWNGQPIPHLRGKRDPYSDNTPQSNWTYTISKAEAAKKLNAGGYGVGNIISLETTRDSLGGRVLELKVTGTNGSKILPKEKVRAVFGYGNVKSTNYKIDGSTDRPGISKPTIPQPDPKPDLPEKPVEPVEPEVKPEVKPEPETIEVYALSGNNNKAEKIDITNADVITADGIKKIDSRNHDVVISNGVQIVVKESKKERGSLPVVATMASMSTNMSLNTRAIGNNIVFRGSGYGHGVGMSQHGANNMAKAGHDFRQILEFYFTGAKVE